jgi:hypothetical protein
MPKETFMSNRLARAIALIALLGSGCGGGQSGGEVGADSEPNGTGGSEPGGTGGTSGSTVGGDGAHDCVVTSTTAVGWTETTPVGTPEEVFAQVPGTCEAPFVWDGTGWTGTLTLDPATGESTVTVTVDVDEASARWVETEKAPDASGIVACGPSLEVDVTVTLDLPEGPVVSQQHTSLAVQQQLGISSLEVPPIRFSVDATDIGDWVTIAAANSDTTTTLNFTVAPLQRTCAGEVGLWTDTPSATGGAAVGGTTGGMGRFASWSNTGCGVDEFPVNLDEPYEGLDLRAAVEQAFGDVQLSGAWEDGGTTTMILKANATAVDVCGDALAVVIPVDVVAETADGRIVSLSGPGTVHAFVHGESLVQLDLWLSEELTCDSETDLLPYRSADCASVAQVTAQLGFNEYLDGSGPTGGQVELYVVNRESSAAAGAADRVDRLTLTR